MQDTASTIDDAQRAVVREFAAIDDPLSEYELLLEYAASHPKMTSEQKAQSKLVEGCQSQVWLHLETRDGILSIQADSDTLVIRGILSLLCRVLNGRPCSEVASCEVFFLEEAELTMTFDNTRKAGIKSILRDIRTFAQASC